MEKDLSTAPQCACDVWLKLLGDRWSLLVVRDIFKGKTTYTEFLESREKIATNILNNRLKSLRSKGIIDFHYDPNNRRIKRYFLTDKGIDLYPIIYAVQMWTLKHENFPLTEYGKKWKAFVDSEDEETVTQHFQEKYKAYKKEVFSLK